MLPQQLMAHILGIDVGPGLTESTSYFPGYRWWPKSSSPGQESDRSIMQQQSPTASTGSPEGWPMESFAMDTAPNFVYDSQSMGNYQQQYGPPAASGNGMFYDMQDLM